MAKEYIEQRPEGMFVAGTGVSLASVVFHFRQGASPEIILQKFPALGTLENVYGAIAFYLGNEATVSKYLLEQERKWQQFRETADALPPELPSRLDRARARTS